jgi:DNA-nicking Smr family endonuclease
LNEKIQNADDDHAFESERRDVTGLRQTKETHSSPFKKSTDTASSRLNFEATADKSGHPSSMSFYPCLSPKSRYTIEQQHTQCVRKIQ